MLKSPTKGVRRGHRLSMAADRVTDRLLLDDLGLNLHCLCQLKTEQFLGKSKEATRGSWPYY